MDELYDSNSRLEILCGPMFAEKTFSLLRSLVQLSELGLNVIYINHGYDNRSICVYSTHSPLLKNEKLDFDTCKLETFEDIAIEAFLKYDVIGIDEAQFFDKSIIPFVLNLVEKHQKYVIVAGLDGDYKRQKFGHVCDLIPYADYVRKLTAFCKRCQIREKKFSRAPFTHCDRLETDENGVMVGGAERYEAVCRECYLELNKSAENE